MKKLYFIAALIIMCAQQSLAKERTLEEKTNVAAALLNGSKGSLKAAPAKGKVRALATLKSADNYTVMGYQDGGFVVVANDDRYEAVVAYSDSKFAESNPAFEWFLGAANTAMANGTARSTQARKMPSGVKTKVDYLLTTTWDQEAPYWNKCPLESSGRNTCTGCVATAMAQIMNFYEYPKKATGTGKYYNESTEQYGTVTFGTEYQWDQMLDSYASNRGTTAQKNAVATLMFHCGAAAQMSYSYDGSGAWTTDAYTGITKNFGYAAQYHGYKDSYASGETEYPNYDYTKWDNAIYKEISDGHPVLYAAASYYYGYDYGFFHAFVLDGYDAQGNVHVNWGYGGTANGYVNLQTLPFNWSASYHQEFDCYQEMIFMHTSGTVNYDLTKGSTGISEVKADVEGNAAVRVYDAAGKEVYSAPAASFDINDVPAKGVLIVKQGQKTRKVVK